MYNFINQIKRNEEYKLSDINRYAGKIKLKEENVAEHSFYTALNVIKICSEFDIEVTENMLGMAIIHDIPEYIVGDIPFEFKRDNPQIMKLFETEELEKSIDKYSNNKYISKKLTNLFKGDIIDNKVVELADQMCALQFAHREKTLGNTTDDIERIYGEAYERVISGYEDIEKALTNDKGGMSNDA